MIDEENENDPDRIKFIENFQKEQEQSEYYAGEQYWSSEHDEKNEENKSKIFHLAFENQICCRHYKNTF